MTATACRWLAAVLLAAIGARADDVKVAVAANFTAPMQEIARGFERETGHRVLLSFGATGALYAQIRHGAPFGLLLAADDETPRRLEREGMAIPGSRFTYAVGRLVLWSARPGLVDDRGEVLVRGGFFSRLAIANPATAPYGAAAMEVLSERGLLERLRPALVQGESIAQTFQFVKSGNAELGFIARAQLPGEGQGSAWLVPAELHRPLRQDVIALKGPGDRPAARALLDYLRGERARAVIETYGYER